MSSSLVIELSQLPKIQESNISLQDYLYIVDSEASDPTKRSFKLKILDLVSFLNNNLDISGGGVGSGEFFIANTEAEVPTNASVGNSLFVSSDLNVSKQGHIFNLQRGALYKWTKNAISGIDFWTVETDERIAFMSDIPAPVDISALTDANISSSLSSTQKENFRDKIDAMDFKLENLSSILDTNEKASIRVKLGIPNPPSLLGLTDANISSGLTTTQKRNFRAKIGARSEDLITDEDISSALNLLKKENFRDKIDALDRKLEDLSSSLSSSEKASILTKIGARNLDKITDTDIANLSDAQKLSFRNKIGAGTGSGNSVDVTNLTDANISNSLSTTQKSNFRGKIDAMDSKLASLSSSLSSSEKSSIRTKLGITLSSGQKLFFADTLNDLPNNPSIGDKLITFSSFSQSRTRPDGSDLDYTFRKGGSYEYQSQEFNLPEGFYSSSQHSFALTSDIPSIPAPVDISALTDANISSSLSSTQKENFRDKIDALDRKLEDLSSSLSSSEKTSILTKIGARSTALITNSDIASSLSSSNQQDFRSKINAVDRDLSEVSNSLTDSEKSILLTKIGARGLDKIINTDISNALTLTQKQNFQERIGISPNPPPIVASALSDVDIRNNDFELNQIFYTEDEFDIPASTIGTAESTKNVDTSAVEDADHGVMFGSPNRIYYQGYSTTTVKSGTASGNNWSFIPSEDITLRSQDTGIYRGGHYGESHVCFMMESSPNLLIYYTSSTKPAGATTNYFKTITTSSTGSPRGVVGVKSKGLIYIIPGSGNTILAYDFDSGNPVPTENITITHPSLRVNDMEFYKQMLILTDFQGQTCHPYDVDRKKEFVGGRFPVRSGSDDFNQTISYSEETFYSFVFNDDVAYAYTLAPWQEGFSAKRGILEYRNSGITEILSAGQKTTFSATAPTIPAPLEGDLWIDKSNPEIVLPYIYSSNKWVPLAQDIKSQLLSKYLNEKERKSLFKRLEIDNQIVYSDDADLLEHNRTYLLRGTAQGTPVSGERWLITDKGQRQIARSYRDGDTYVRTENPGYPNYSVKRTHILHSNLIGNTRNSDIGVDTVYLFDATPRINPTDTRTRFAPDGLTGIIYGAELTVGSEVRTYQIAISGDKVLWRYTLDTSNDRLENKTWNEGLDENLLVTNDIARVPKTDSQIWILKQGVRGDSENVSINTLRVFQRKIESTFIMERLFWAEEDTSQANNPTQVYKVERNRSLRFVFSPWTKHWGQVYPSMDDIPPVDNSKLWDDLNQNELKRYYTRAVTQGARNNQFEFSLPLDIGIVGSLFSDHHNRVFYVSDLSGSNRNLRAINYQGVRQASGDINVGIQNENAVISGGLHDEYNLRILVLDGGALAGSLKKFFAYDPVDRSYQSESDIDLSDIPDINAFYGGYFHMNNGNPEAHLLGIKSSGSAIVKIDLREATYGAHLSTHDLTGLTNPIYLTGDGTNYYILDNVSGTHNPKAYSIATRARVTSQDINLDDDNDSHARAVHYFQGINYVLDDRLKSYVLRIGAQGSLGTGSWAGLAKLQGKYYTIDNDVSNPNNTNYLYEVNKTNGTKTQIMEIGVGDWEAITGKEDEHVLLLINSTTDSIYKVDPIRQTKTLIGSEGSLPSGRYTGMAYSQTLSQCFAINNSRLYRINLSNGTGALIGNLPSGSWHSLAFRSSQAYTINTTDKKLYELNVSDASVDKFSDTALASTNFYSLEEDGDNLLTISSNTLYRINLIINKRVFAYNNGATVSVWDNINDIDSLKTSMYQDFSVTRAKLAINVIDNSRLAENAVLTYNIADDQITTPKIKDFQVTLNKLAINSVDDSKIVSKTITPDKLAPTGHARAILHISNSGDDVEWLDANLLDHHTFDLLDQVESSDKYFELALNTAKNFTFGASVSGALTTPKSYLVAMAIDRYKNMYQYWRTSNASGQGHLRLSPLVGGSASDHTMSSLNGATNVFLSTDGANIWTLHSPHNKSNELHLNRLHRGAFYFDDNFVIPSGIISSTIGSAGNLRGFVILRDDYHQWSQIAIASSNRVYFLNFNYAVGFSSVGSGTINTETHNITSIRGICQAGRDNNLLYVVDEPVTEVVRAFNLTTKARVSGKDFSFQGNNSSYSRRYFCGMKDVVLQAVQTSNTDANALKLLTGQVDYDLKVKKIIMQGNNKRLVTNSSGSLIVETIS